MIPILYKGSEAAFSTNGIGFLRDAISCDVVEERNGAYELSLLYPASGQFAKELKPNTIIKAKASDVGEPQLFRVVIVTPNIKKQLDVYAQHIRYDLNKNPIMKFEYTGTTQGALDTALQSTLYEHNFTAWTDSNTSSSTNILEPLVAGQALAGKDGSILDHWGGEYEFDNFEIKLHTRRGKDTDVLIEYGKNLTDFGQETSILETFTGIVPFAKVSDEDSDETITLPERVLYAENAGEFPQPLVGVVDLSDQAGENPTEASLRSAAKSYIIRNKIGVPRVNIKISFIPLWQTKQYETVAQLEQLALCDTATVRFSDFNVDANAKVIKTTYNTLKERYDSIELGDARANFGQTISVLSDQVTKIQNNENYIISKAVQDATSVITGSRGGNVVIVLDESGNPSEICFMDTKNIATAKRVLRINLDGIGFSNNGFNGPFHTAWTIDGVFNADFIRAGRLESRNNKDVYFDLDKGHLRADRLVSGNKSLADVYATIGDEFSAGKYGIFTLYASGEPIFNVYHHYSLPGMVPTGGISIGRGINDNGTIIMDDEEVRILSSEKLDLTGRGGLSIWGSTTIIDNVDGVIDDLQDRVTELEKKVGL